MVASGPTSGIRSAGPAVEHASRHADVAMPPHRRNKGRMRGHILTRRRGMTAWSAQMFG